MKRDKLLHIFWGAFFAAVVGIGCYVGSYNEATDTYSLFAGLWGCTAGIIAGGVKEWCDNVYEWEWDWKDLIATCIGVLVAVLFILGLHFGKG